MNVKIREIFSSIQGEGPYVGYKQLFIRFCRCNLDCAFCDTDFDINKSKDYSVDELVEICNNNKDCHSVSLTGGEPLIETDFLKEFLPKSPLPIYLETNGTLYENLNTLIDYIRYISADIKLQSATGQITDWDSHDKFFSIAKNKILFAKVVFNDKITENEILKITDLCKKYNIELILQPLMIEKTFSIDSNFMMHVLNECLSHYKKTRLIPQVHKYIDNIK